MEDRHSRKMIAPIVITVLMVMYYVGFFVTCIFYADAGSAETAVWTCADFTYGGLYFCPGGKNQRDKERRRG